MSFVELATFCTIVPVETEQKPLLDISLQTLNFYNFDP